MISFSCRLSRSRFVLEADFAYPGGCTALFGPSGSGKTTIARLIAGSERPDRGRIVGAGHVVVDTAAGLWEPAHRRRVGLVFQDGQLLPHLTVRQNLAYGRYFAPRGTGRVVFDEVVDLLGIGHLLAARPLTLSGGERQRVAIGRALLAAPRILVMDEPLASLDAERKHEILPFIERLRDDLGLPIVYVSHAVEEVARLATQVVRLAGGRVVAKGTPVEVFASQVADEAPDRPETVSFLSGRVIREMPEFAISVIPALMGRARGTVRVAVQGANVTLATERPSHLSVRTVLEGRIASVTAGAGPAGVVTVDLEGGDRLAAHVTRHAISDLGLVAGKQVFALVKAVAIDEHGLGRFDGRTASKEQE